MTKHCMTPCSNGHKNGSELTGIEAISRQPLSLYFRTYILAASVQDLHLS